MPTTKGGRRMKIAFDLPVFDEAEVVVLGSGSAGTVAAIAAARTGADTLLVERYGFLGGTSVIVLDTFYGFYTPGAESRRVVGGLPWEIVERLRRADDVLERPNTYGAGTGVTYDPEALEVAGKSGLGVVLGKIFVDASGDADLCHWAGGPYEAAHLSGQAQSLTTTFRLGNVNVTQAMTIKRAELEKGMKAANVSGDYRL